MRADASSGYRARRGRFPGPSTDPPSGSRAPEVPPATSCAARTISWPTLAYGDTARGVSPEQLRLAVCSPALEPAFIEQALDGRPDAPLCFTAKANLNRVISRYMRDVDSGEVRIFVRVVSASSSPATRFPFDLAGARGLTPAAR